MRQDDLDTKLQNTDEATWNRPGLTEKAIIFSWCVIYCAGPAHRVSDNPLDQSSACMERCKMGAAEWRAKQRAKKAARGWSG